MDIPRFLHSFDTLRATERGKVCGLAFCFLEAVRDTAPEGVDRHAAPRPHVDTLRALLPQLSVPALLFQDREFAEMATDGDWLDPEVLLSGGRGAVLLFEDLTALWCDPLVVSETEINLQHAEVTFEAPFHRDRNIILLGTSRAFKALHGPSATWMASLPCEEEIYARVDEDIIDLLISEIEDLIDPPCDSVDMRDRKNWDAADISELETTLALTWAATGARCGVLLEITAADPEDGNGHEREISILEADGEDEVALAEAYEALLDAVVDLDRFQGASWEYNDGAYDRISGYSLFQTHLLSLEIMPGDGKLSNHQRLAARPILEERMRANGKDDSEIADLFAYFEASAA